MIDDYVIESVDREIVVRTVGQQTVIEAGPRPVILQPAGFDGLIPFITQVARDAAVGSGGGQAKPVPIIRTVKPSGGDYASLQAANEDIKDSSAAKPYWVLVWPNTGDGSWPVKEFASKAHIHWQAVGPARGWLKCYQAPDTDPALIEANSALRVTRTCQFTGFRITGQNVRYVWHGDDGAMVGQTIVFSDCDLEHLGNQEAKDWQAANGGNPASIWASDSAIGIGTMPRVVIRFDDGCRLAARRNAILIHTLNPPDWPSVVSDAGARFEFINSRTERREQNAEAAIVQSFNSGHRHIFLMEGSRFDGVIDGSVRAGTAKEWVAVGHAPSGTVITAAIPSQVTIY